MGIEEINKEELLSLSERTENNCGVN